MFLSSVYFPIDCLKNQILVELTFNYGIFKINYYKFQSFCRTLVNEIIIGTPNIPYIKINPLIEEKLVPQTKNDSEIDDISPVKILYFIVFY